LSKQNNPTPEGKEKKLTDKDTKRTPKCCPCGSTHTGINRLPDGSFILHCDESCGARWETKTFNRGDLLE